MTAPAPAPLGETAEAYVAALGRVMARVAADADRASVLQTITDGLVQDLGVVVARIWQYDAADDALHLRAATGLSGRAGARPERIPLRALQPPFRHALERREVVVINEIDGSSGFTGIDWIERERLRAFAGFPLLVGGRLAGAMVVFQRNTLPPLLVETLGILAQQAALALEHARVLEESHALQGIAAELAAARDTNALLDGLVQRAVSALGADACAVWFITDDGWLVPGANVGLSAEFFERLSADASGETTVIFRELQRTGRALSTRDDQAAARALNAGLADVLADEGIVSALRMPLFEPGGAVIGMLALYHRRERVYSASEVRLAQAFTDQIAVALHNAALAEQERAAQASAERQMERLTTLAEITERLLGVSNLNEVLHVVAEAAVRLCGAKGAVVAITDSARRHLVPAAHHGELQAWFDSFTEANLDEALRAATPTARALTTGEPVLLADYAAGPVERPSQAATIASGVRAFIAAPLRKGEEPLGMLWVADTTADSLTSEDAALVKALADQAALAIEQTRLIEESHALQVIAAELASTRDMDTLMEGIVERTMAAFGADACAVWLLDAESGRLQAGAAQGLPRPFFDQVAELLDLTSETSGAAFKEVRRTRRPLYTRDDQARARASDDLLARALAEVGIISALRLPLFAPGGDVTGMLALYHRRERSYSDGEVRLAQAFTDQTAVALHNADLAEKEREAQAAAKLRLERLRAVAQITEQLLTTTDLESVLRVVVEAAARLCNAGGAMIGLVDADRRTISRAATYGSVRFFQHAPPPLELDTADRTATGHVFVTGRTVVVEDYATWQRTTEAQRYAIESGLRAIVVAPVRVGGTIAGVLWVADTTPGAFAADDVALVEALADQTALAIEHARLVRRGQDAAVLEERTRLARDLHDSVTQSVFSLGMLARAAQTQHARGAATLRTTLERIERLAQEALQEMRALLFELQPSGLVEEGLATALDRLVAAARVRSDVTIEYTAETSLRLHVDVETAIFRIVQEALANAAKHARATRVTVTLAAVTPGLRVTVADDGVGFDPEAPVAASADGRQGGMGMRTMRERAAAAGITLRIESAPGAGAAITIEAPCPAG